MRKPQPAARLYGRLVIVVFTGRRPSDDGAFPAENVDFVEERLQRLLAGLRPRQSFGSAAAGADLIAATAAAEAGSEVRLITAGPLAQFEVASVADKGPEWSARLHGLLRRDHVSVEELDTAADDSGFSAVNQAILDAASDAREPDEEIVVIVVSEGRREGLDHTADLADEAGAAGHLVLRVDPGVSRADMPVAFVAMPYGLRKDPLPGRPDYDADLTWHRILVPVLVDGGYRPIRVDLEASLEIIDAKMIRGIGQAALLVADLAHHNPNVFWELGVRHAWTPAGTLLVAPDDAPRPPFDVNHLTVHAYSRDVAEVSDLHAVAAIRMLKPVLASAHDSIDSPVFAALPGLQPARLPPPANDEGEAVVTSVAERISLDADLNRADELIAMAATLPHAGMAKPQADGLREQIALALLDLDRPNDALPLLRLLALADTDLERTLLQQRFALALMRADDPPDQADQRLIDAEDLLARLDAKHPPTGETLGLLGSAAKRMFRRSSEGAHLDRAISAYLRGFYADPQDYYPGVNAVALLRARALRDGSAADTEQARRLLPVVQFMVDRPGLADTVWRQATAAELQLHRFLLDGEPTLDSVIALYVAAARLATPFQVTSMREQLALLRDLGDPADVIGAVVDALPRR
jgi:hypothetical protein